MINWLDHNLGLLAQLTVTHVYLAAIPILASFVVSVPLGAVAARWAPARAVLLGVGNVVYTIPSIALVLVLPAILGTPFLDDANILVMLTIYGVALKVRASADGFASVDGSV